VAAPKRTINRENVASAAGGGGVGVLLVWVLQLFGVPLTPAASASLVAMITAACVALGQNGIVGIAQRLWRGDKDDDDLNGREKNNI
jgi:hypothetical protein